MYEGGYGLGGGKCGGGEWRLRALWLCHSKYSHSKYSVLALPLLRYLGEAELERLRLELEGRDLVAIWDALDLDLVS